jgi:hypothetical protein
VKLFGKQEMIQVGGRAISVSGKLLRIGCIDGDGYAFVEDAEPLVEALRKANSGIDIFTFIQKVNEPQPKYQYPMEWDNYAGQPITTFEKWWTDKLGFKARNKAKQALKKGAVVREVDFSDSLVEGIWKIYNECPIRQGRRFPHYGKDLATVHKEAATFLDRSVFIGAFHEDSLIGFIKVVADETKTQAGLMNIVCMVRHRDKAPANALIVEAVRSCAKRGIGHLVYSQFAYGKKQQSTLSEFKSRNGFERIDVPRYYVPLTAFGALAYKAGLHRRLADQIPEELASKLRDLREAWYARRYSAANEAF